MGPSVVAQVIAAVFVPLVAVWLTAKMTSRETTRAVRTEVMAQRLTALADDLANTSRDLRDSLFARDACGACGRGISAARLIEIADRVDRTVDIALLHVRDEVLRNRLSEVIKSAALVRAHPRNAGEPCEDLLAGAYAVVAVCDQVAEQCLNLVHAGRAIVPPRIPMNGIDRTLTWVFSLVERRV